MFPVGRPVAEIIPQRHSSRIFNEASLAAEQVRPLESFMRSVQTGPFGTPVRLALAAATADDPGALRSLGTYGLIKHAAGFIIGATGPGEKNLENYGYALETIVLYATQLGLGTCWLGGNFTKASFASQIKATRDEIVPAVIAVGYTSEANLARDWLRRQAKADTRQPWEKLFFDASFATALSIAEAGPYAQPLEMLRLAPSGKNYQPWRIVRQGNGFHFYLQRTAGYGRGSAVALVMGLVDLPRVEIGIAMSHFELTARELGLKGKWEIQAPSGDGRDAAPEYVITWVG